MGIDVVCAFIVRDEKVWMGRRPAHKHMGGKFEFPGGKVNDEETREAAIQRELLEELGVESQVGEELVSITYEYSEKTIQLTAFRVSTSNSITLLEHDAQRWVGVDEGPSEDWAPADVKLWAAFQKARRAG